MTASTEMCGHGCSYTKEGHTTYWDRVDHEFTPAQPVEQRYDHYLDIQDGNEIEDGHIFCTPTEAEEIKRLLIDGLPDDVVVNIEGGGEYDYTTEDGTTVTQIAASILSVSGFIDEEGGE